MDSGFTSSLSSTLTSAKKRSSNIISIIPLTDVEKTHAMRAMAKYLDQGGKRQNTVEHNLTKV